MPLAGFLATAPVRRVVAVNSAGLDASPVKKYDWAAGQVAAIGASSARTGAVNATEVAISVSTGAWVRFGTAGAVTAVHGGAGSMYLAAGGPYNFQFTSGEAVACIHSTGTGHLSVHPVV